MERARALGTRRRNNKYMVRADDYVRTLLVTYVTVAGGKEGGYEKSYNKRRPVHVRGDDRFGAEGGIRTKRKSNLIRRERFRTHRSIVGR